MHFFIDYDLLTNQSASGDSFGPTLNFDKEWDVSADFQLSSDAKAFACQSGMMVVVPYYDVGTSSIDSNLVNIIIKPSTGLDIAFPRVQYYIYRGIKKDSFFDSGGAIQPDDPSNSEFIAQIWDDYDKLVGLGLSPAAPVPADIGFDATLTGSLNIENVFNGSQAPVKAHDVFEGECLGTFTSTSGKKIGFEVIVDTNLLDVNIDYVQKSKYRVDVTALVGIPSPTPAQEYDLKIAQEKILSWVDPAAFFGMHYYVGVKASKDTGGGSISTSRKRRQNLYDDLLDNRFNTKDRIYLDIRSEKGYSYSFYGNYKDVADNDHDLKVKPTNATNFMAQPYALWGWPIFYDANWIGTKKRNQVDIQLRVDDNTKPLLYFMESKFRTKSRRKHFMSADDLLDGSSTEWTKTIRIRFPNGGSSPNKHNIAHWIRMQYFRQEDNTSSPASVLKLGPDRHDTIFGGILLPEIATAVQFQHLWQAKTGFVKGADFSYVPDTGAYFDSSAVVLYTEKREAYDQTSKNRYPKWSRKNKDLPFDNLGVSPVLPKEMIFNKWRIEETTGVFVDILELSSYQRGTKRPRVDDIYFLGLTRTELTDLQATGTGTFGAGHQRYLMFEEQTNQEDVNGISFRKWKLKLQGLNTDGDRVEVTPSPDIFVYGAGKNIMCSSGFAGLTTLPTSIPDPGILEQFPLAKKETYDRTTTAVTNIFPGATTSPAGPLPAGFSAVADTGSNQGSSSHKVEIRGDFYFPVDDLADTTPSSIKSNYPLVVIVHGNGQRYESYDDVGLHLARNGFIVASIDLLVQSVGACYPTGGGTYDRYCPEADTIFLYDTTTGDIAIYDSSTGTATPQSWTSPADFDYDAGPPATLTIKTADYAFHGMASEGRANVLFDHLRVIEERFGSKVQNKVGLVGHSRGGEAVVRAAAQIGTSMAPSSLSNIDAILSLAPTDQYQKEILTSNIPYYVLYGSLDGDVSGQVYVNGSSGAAKAGRAIFGAGDRGSGGFSLYDRANNNQVKSMSFMYGATHNGFITNNGDYGGTVSTETPATQIRVSKAYMNAFFRSHLKGETIWKPYFTGDRIPRSVEYSAIYQQYQDMGSSTKVVDSFESGTATNTSSEGEIVTYSWTPGTLSEGVLIDIDRLSPHESKGTLLEWNGGEKVTFTANSSGTNVSSLEAFSFRISHKADVSSSSYPSIDSMKVALVDTSNNRHEASLTRNIPNPHARKTETVGNFKDFNYRTKSAMMTVRIPLSEFSSGGVNLSNVKEVELIFPASGSGLIDIDDLEFTK